MTDGLVAVTGASGFVGGYILDALAASGLGVRALVRDPSRVRADVERVAVDLPGTIPPEALSGVRALVHASAHKPKNFEDPSEVARCMEVNATGTVRLLEAAVLAGVETFVYLGAGNAYVDGVGPADEAAPMYPSGRAPYYLTSKVAGEILASHYAPRLRVVALRPSAVYGARMGGGAFVHFARKLRAKEPIEVADGGRYAADFVHARDVAQAVVASVRRPVRGAFNVASGTSTSILDVATKLAALAGAPPELVVVKPAVGAGPTGFRALDPSRARTELGLAPSSLEAGLREVLEGVA